MPHPLSSRRGRHTSFYLKGPLTLHPISFHPWSIGHLPPPSAIQQKQPTPPLRGGWIRPHSQPNGVTTTGGRPPRPHLTHLKSIPPSHLTFSLQLHRTSHSLLVQQPFQWTSDYVLNVYCPFAAAPPPFANTCHASHFS